MMSESAAKEFKQGTLYIKLSTGDQLWVWDPWKVGTGLNSIPTTDSMVRFAPVCDVRKEDHEPYDPSAKGNPTRGYEGKGIYASPAHIVTIQTGPSLVNMGLQR